MIRLLIDASEEGIYAKDIAEELNISTAMVSKYKKQLEKEDLIFSSKGKTPICISEKGKQAYAN